MASLFSEPNELSRKNPILVSVIMGSDSDYKIMKQAINALEDLGVSYEKRVISAHRTPHEMLGFAKEAGKRGLAAIIAGAGGAAHLPGMVAACTHLPVIGVPVPNGALQGVDALHSIVQMPKGVPVATVAIGGAYNAGILAAQIAAAKDSDLQAKIIRYKQKLREESLTKTLD